MADPASGLVLGVFQREQDILEAARATRSAGYRIHDAFTPCAVHGLDEAMGLRPSRLPRVCFTFAAAGLSLALCGQFWIGSIDWPLDVGGKPFNSLPAYLPGTFEATVLLAGVGTVFTLFWRARLNPWKSLWLAHARATDDRFVLAVEAGAAALAALAPAARGDVAGDLGVLWRPFEPVEVLEVPGGAR